MPFGLAYLVLSFCLIYLSLKNEYIKSIIKGGKGNGEIKQR